MRFCYNLISNCIVKVISVDTLLIRATCSYLLKNSKSNTYKHIQWGTQHTAQHKSFLKIRDHTVLELDYKYPNKLRCEQRPTLLICTYFADK